MKSCVERQRLADVVGKFAEAGVLGLLVYAALAGGLWLGIPPVVQLVEWDERIYTRLDEPPPVSEPDVAPVVWMDVDDATMLAWPRANPAAGTPRRLLADLVGLAKRFGASSILVDIDLRSPMSDDDAMVAAMRSPGAPTLLPQFFPARAKPRCGSTAQREERLPSLLALAVLGTRGTVPVHTEFEREWDGGAVHGLCPAYPVALADGRRGLLRAAPLVAVTLADRVPIATEDARVLPITWRLGIDRRCFEDQDGRRVFQRVSAQAWLKGSAPVGGAGCTPSRSPGGDARTAMQGAIVIIGSSHAGSGDPVPTPLEDMPAALVVANAMLSAQAPETPAWWREQFFDLASLILVPALSAALCTWRRRGRAAQEAELDSTALDIALDTVVVFGIWCALSAFVLLSGAWLGYQPGNWRFGIVSGLTSIAIVLVVQSSLFLSAMSRLGIVRVVHRLTSRRRYL